MADDEVIDDGQVEDTGDETLRDSIESAFSGDTGEGEGASGSGSAEAAGGNVPGTDGANASTDEGAAPPTDESAASASSGESGGDKDPAAGDKAPVGWGPELREQWAALPDGIKKQVNAREQHMAQAMQGTAQARQIAQDFGGMSQKYGSVMAAEGVKNPMQMVDTMFQTVAELRMGSPAQKAQKIAQLIQNYGVDISTLDDQLSTQVSGQPAPAQQGMDPNMQHMIDQRMQPVNQMMQQLAGMQQNKQRQDQQQAHQEVDQFAQSAEFLNDVRHDVADLIDMATRQGRDMPLQEAYDKACAMNPAIANVLADRAQQQSLANAGQNISSKRRAASSLAPGNAGGNSTKAPRTMSEALNAAWDDQLGG
jgi:predicted phage tail protein